MTIKMDRNILFCNIRTLRGIQVPTASWDLDALRKRFPDLDFPDEPQPDWMDVDEAHLEWHDGGKVTPYSIPKGYLFLSEKGWNHYRADIKAEYEAAREALPPDRRQYVREWPAWESLMDEGFMAQRKTLKRKLKAAEAKLAEAQATVEYLRSLA